MYLPPTATRKPEKHVALDEFHMLAALGHMAKLGEPGHRKLSPSHFLLELSGPTRICLGGRWYC
jgi:hypothetical protein